MATSPNPEYEIPSGFKVAVEAPEAGGSSPDVAIPGRDALQALLAFSSLHQQVQQRHDDAGGNPSDQGPDDFLLYEVLQLVCERALTVTAADGVAIALVHGQEIVCRAAAGPIAPDVGVRLDPNSGFSGACFRTGEMVRCDDAENDPRVNVEALRRLQARSLLAVPLRGRRSVIGLLEAFSTEAYGFNNSDVRSLSLLAELILGAMKPEEEQEFEAQSPVAIHLPTGTKLTAPVETSQPASFEDFPALEMPAVEALDEALVDAPPVADHSPEPEPFEDVSVLPGEGRVLRSRLMVVALAAAVILLTIGATWWRLRSRTTASASVDAAKASSHLAQTKSVESPPVLTATDLTTEGRVSPDDENRNALPLVTGIRHWESGDATSVAIDLQDQVQYEVHRLSSPERIYFDLHDTVLGPGLSGKTIEVGDSLLLRIRIAQPMAGISRVVLETKDVSNFSVSLAQNPFRLVAEIRNTPADGQPKAKIDLLHPKKQEETNALTSALEPISKEDRQLRTLVPHMKIVIDAGHGGWDLGTVGRKGLLEKDLVLDVAQRLGDLLRARLGTDVVYTRGDDTYIPLERRAEIANETQADVFVSIHANYSDYPSARGVETYYTNFSSPTNSLEIEKRENATANQIPTPVSLTGQALKERTEESRQLAASVERALHSVLSTRNPGIRDRGVKEAGFVVLTGTSMPAILAEVSFVSSPADEEKLQSTEYRQHIAMALYKGIARYAATSTHIKVASAAGKPAGR
ncbi:MAG TPA: N-acetylmuramoyl-L-alanine amidase [Terriglobales bacterium]|jgi:N-acetylmuramoyl-L-alanine amidase